MDLMSLRVFQRQVLLQCDFLLRAANDVNSALNNGDIDGTFYGIQNLIDRSRKHFESVVGSGREAVRRKTGIARQLRN